MHKNKSANVVLFQMTSALIVACFLVYKADCYRLKKADRRKYSPEGLRRGKIVFGEVLHGDPPLLEEKSKKANISVQDEAAYQADSTGDWAVSPIPLKPPTSQEASLRRLTSLQCGDHHMKLSVKTPWLSHMTVQQAPNAPPLPLPLVPLNCGYIVHRNTLGFLIYVPYGGCYMLQQAGSYVLPMHWQGIPVLLMCTKHSPTDAPKVAAPLPTKVPNMGHVPKVPPIPRGPGSPLGIWSPNDPHGLSQSPFWPRSHSPHPVPHVPKWPFVPNWPPVPHPGLQKPPLPKDPMYNYRLPAPHNPYMSHYPVMPHMPYVHNMPRPYQVPNGMAEYPVYNPSLWNFPEHKPRSGNSKQNDPGKSATLLKFPQGPQTTLAPMKTTIPAPTTAAPATDTTALPYNPLFQYPPELMHYISYEDLLAAMYANQQK
ncbi:protein enabled homolog [Corythoichthys intestinalis]|uniref:protein enabled homolog n=1 Tax=Corythoichthys intestinalis TaxID=161448 RepID=UPI0025A5BCB0|nr:protein enabled homolog [Corythoichthys intestinalis]